MTNSAAYVQAGQLVKPDADSLGGPLSGIGWLQTTTTTSRVASGDSGSGSGTRSRIELSLTADHQQRPELSKGDRRIGIEGNEIKKDETK